MAAFEFSDIQKDALAEVMNISMGNAATAASELLNAKVWITTPKVSVKKASDIHDKSLEPAVCVKITYIKGISGSNIMVLKQNDVQLILCQLMSMPLVVTDDFEFDEINISAVSEVMNQMMGASATALSSFLGIHIDISTPQPFIMEEIELSEIQDFAPDADVVAINFDLTIEGVIKSEFVSVMEIELAQLVADKMLGMSTEEPEPEPAPNAPKAKVQKDIKGATETEIGRMPSQPPPQMMQQPPQQPQYAPQQPYPQQPYPPQMPYPPQPYPPYGGQYMEQPPGYGAYPPPYAYGYPPAQSVNIQNAQLHQFDMPDFDLSGDQKENLSLLMGVPLQITVQIGTAKRKVKDILEFAQGTIIELDRQAGAPVDIVVNGNLVAKGDVVVVDDNFAVRITEIIKEKLMNSVASGLEA
jgi:flagellar motor switch protein FliN/FliY